VAEARALLGPDVWVGASVHGPERARQATAEGADYLVVGTIFETPSHPACVGGGVALLASLREESELPILAIGGVTPKRVAGLLAAGAHGVAVLRGVWDSPEPGQAVREYLEAMEGR
jgi:thiamine-phosphate diphosphorylase